MTVNIYDRNFIGCPTFARHFSQSHIPQKSDRLPDITDDFLHEPPNSRRVYRTGLTKLDNCGAATVYVDTFNAHVQDNE